jgi:hypothetical protein
MKRAAIAFTAILVFGDLGGRLAFRVAANEQVDLIARLTAADLAKLAVRDASVHQDPASKALTFTFNYSEGEPEVRVPVRQLGWPTDWRAWRSIQYTFATTSVETISIAFSDGKVTRAFITEPLSGIRIAGVIPFESFVQTRTMNPLLPLGYKVWINRLFTFDGVEEVVFTMRHPSQPSQLTLYNFTLREDVPADDIIDRKPLIDPYGQWIPENWPGKAHGDDGLRTLWAADTLKPVDYGFCPLGGDKSRTVRKTGFFRVEKLDGRWMMVDPHGHPFFSTGMDLVGYKQGSFGTDVSRREYLFQQLPEPGPAWLTPGKAVSFYTANIMRRFGDGWEKKWQDHIIARLKNWGFNTVANWSDYDVATTSGMPHVIPLEGWTTGKVFPFPWNFPDVFSKEFRDNVDQAARRQLTSLRGDPNLIGWFIGNEPQWARSFGSLTPWPDMLLADPEPSATKSKLEELLEANPGREQQVKDEFLYTCAAEYFSVIVEAVRRHDPNHLVLGIRFAGNPNDRWVEMSRLFDVFSINIYSRDFMPDPKNIRRFSEISGKPVLIGEFTAAAAGRGLQGLFYGVHKVRDQAERGKAYRYYVENSAASPHIIGTHWFQMVDNLPTGRPSDGERLNYGFINVIDLPYAELVEAARQTHRRIYRLKNGVEKPYAEKPRSN